jgi:hypothetical protein
MDMERLVGRIDAEVVRESGRKTLLDAGQVVETREDRAVRQQMMLKKAQWLRELAAAMEKQRG